MNIDRLRKIIEYSEKNRTQMDSKVAKFYSFTGISEDKDMLNILQIVRPALRQRGTLYWKYRLRMKKSGHCATMEMHWDIF